MSPRTIRATALSWALAFVALPTWAQTPTSEVIRPVKLYPVKDSAKGNIRRFPATVHASEESMIAFKVGGELEELPVLNGQEVKAGQLLAQLDKRDYENEVALRQADYNLANSNYQRIKSLFQQKAMSQAELDNATNKYQSAKVALKLANDRLADTELRAPFAGRVARIEVENHQQVQPNQTILLLQNTDTLEIRIQAPENIISQLNADKVDLDYQPEVTFGNQSKGYLAKYKEHATSATPGTLSYEVTFTLPAPKELNIYPGMGATVNADMARVFNASDRSGIVVPVAAVLKDDSTGQDQVWVYNQSTQEVNPVVVKVGRITQGGIHILNGLKDSDQIVAAGLSRLYAGMKVKPLIRERGL